jgi:hypothetical protein
MKGPRTTESSHCVVCGGRLRNAVFCPVCGGSSCSWACSMRHAAQHSMHPVRPASYQGEPRRDEWQDPMAEQAFAG